MRDQVSSIALTHSSIRKGRGIIWNWVSEEDQKEYLDYNISSYTIFDSAQCTNHLPHGNELKKVVDGAFNLMDVDNNGMLSNDELDALWLKDDINRKSFLYLLLFYL